MGAESHESFKKSLTAGQYLKIEIARQGYSVGDFAEKCGVAPQSIYNITGGNRTISSKLAAKLSQHLGGSIAFWLGNSFPDPRIQSGEEDIAPTPRQSGLLVDREIRLLNERDEDEGFLISPLSDEQIKGASVDLRVGLVVTKGFDTIPRDERDLWSQLAEWKASAPMLNGDTYAELEREKGIVCSIKHVLKPGKSVHVVTREFVHLGLQIVGHLGEISERNLEGLVVRCGFQIDPGFSGPLVFRVKNDGDAPIALDHLAPIVSLSLQKTNIRAEQRYDKTRVSRIEPFLKELRRKLGALVKTREEGGRVTFSMIDADRCWEAPTRNEATKKFLGFVAKAWGGAKTEEAANVRDALRAISLDDDAIKALAAALPDSNEQAALAALNQSGEPQPTLELNRALALLSTEAPARHLEYQREVLSFLTVIP
ncbi:MAG: helix-turn-helix domain-containing protein [Pseudomonadota bacterium]